PFENDSNSLNKPFYSELLYIIGLEEKPKSGKRVIQRVNEKERQEESLIENIITKLRAHRILDDIDEEELEGETIEDRYFNIALELAITWINRILFLKLLESVLLNYHNDDTDYAFLATDKITEFDNLDTLFFEVLAEKMADRSKSVKERYSLIPYLNSSLFEPTALEKKATFIADLKDNLKLPIFSKSVLKKGGAKKGKKKPSLEYLLDFLAAYDFGVEGKEAIKKESKTIINASVLGRIFEKINGYKEGSFFTPGAITEYMCRETIRKTVIDKFSQYFKKEFDTFDGLGNFIRRNVYEPKEILTANKVINNLKFCDPAVGSGHFLVSALNEIIAIKSELGILCDKNGKTIELLAKVESDELIIEDKDEKQLQYALGKYGKPNAEMQRIQETIFHEKETIIENCLFGVDINQNSVKICQLRLWIELLKNAYYTKDSQYKELQTLPNIDINIKQGNSLVSRFRIDDRLSGFPAKTQQKMRLATEKYKEQVFLYKSTDEKTVKKNAEKEIERIKKTFSTIHDPSDKDYKLWKEKEVEQITKQSEIPFGDEKERKICGEKINKLAKEALLLKEKYEEKLKTLYGNAFEWRFEFPEILSEKGEFVGFDIVMGNPPYIGEKDHSELFKHYKKLSKWNSILTRRTNLYYAFLVNSYELLVSDGRCSLIVPNEILTSDYAKHIRTHLAKTTQINHIVDFNKNQVFKGVGANVMIFDYGKLTEKKERIYRKYVKSGVTENLFELDYDDRVFEAKYLKKNKYWRFVNEYDITNTELVTIDYYGLTTQQGVITGCNSAKGKLFNKVLESNPELSALSGLGVYVLEEGTDIEHRNGSTFINNTQDRTAPNWVKLNKIEQEYVKSLYRGNQIKKYTIEPTYSYLIWFHKGNYSSSSNYKIPNIIKHLENFKILLI
nr:Eco57I restriction-modification methylase domain-containing protein [Bacteroidota bacterium]